MSENSNYLVLARKYRPQNFNELVGQHYTKQTLINALDSGKLHHGFLFTGTRGVGKTTIARILAKSINCEQGISSTPCGECESCRSISAGHSIDVVEIDAASHTGVDHIRNLLESAQFAPSKSRFKIYIIDEVHMLSSSSFNALLKTLEEPPEHIKFIFATTDPQKIPVTILSRCLQFNLQNLSVIEISTQLQHILTLEHLTFEEEALTHIAELGNGSLRDSLSILDQAIAFANGNITLDAITAMLGIVAQQTTYELVDALLNGKSAQLIDIIDNSYKNGANLHELLKSVASLIHKITLAQVVASTDERINTWAQQIENKTLQIYYQILTLALRDAKFALNDKVNLEMALLRILTLSGDEVGKKKLS